MDFSQIELTEDNFRLFKYSNRPDNYFEFIDEEHYVISNQSQRILWPVSFHDFNKFFHGNRWKIVGYSSMGLHGPLQPPPSKVCLKIRQMEERRNKYV